MWRFYSGMALQLVGLSSVAICFISGIQKGDYGRVELLQLVFGAFIFYAGSFVRKK